MKNLLGALVGILLGATFLVWVLNIPDPVYNWPYNTIWFIFSGSNSLRLSLWKLFDYTTQLGTILDWIFIGAILGLVSKKGWNTLRTSLWSGLILGILSLVSIMLENTAFWTSPTRNVDLFYHFLMSIGVSFLAIPSAIIVSIVINRIRRQSEIPIPEKIETLCDCGAIFKSNPLICSECGRQLREIQS